jgi:hypothetical protein
MLEHLILVPEAGLCNRLRAIASARRLCQRVGAKCSLVWDWGDFEHFFAPVAALDVLSVGPWCVPSVRLRFKSSLPGRTVDVRTKTLKVRTGLLFWGHDEPQIKLRDVRDWVPRPHPRLASTVEQFARERLNGAVGLHIRRTDHEDAIRQSPDHLFVQEAQRLIEAGKRIFLATDNVPTEQMMVRRFGEHIVIHPRRKVLANRWPRPQFDPIALEDDLLDLFLLVRTEYVVGCYHSSFSGLAMALNGSAQCRRLLASPTASS